MTKSSLIPVEGHPNFCRDKNTGAIVNVPLSLLTTKGTPKKRWKD